MSWKLRGAVSRRVDVDEHVVAAGARQRDGQRELPLGGTGGCLWMIEERSSRTMMRCTPVCGPPPVRNCVSTLPSGVRTARRSVVVPGAATVFGPCQSSVYSRAGATVGGAGEPPPPPQAGCEQRERDQRAPPGRAHWPSGKR